MYDEDASDLEELLEPLTGSMHDLGALPPILPRFFVPRLVEKPQNPIMDTLRLASTHEYSQKTLSFIPTELAVILSDPNHQQRPPKRAKSNHLWRDAVTRSLGIRSEALSWDRLRSSHPSAASSTGFLSEQENLVFASARYHVQSCLRDPSVEIVYVTQSDLFRAMKMTVLGISSTLHTWDTSTERFVQAGVDPGKLGLLHMDGMDEVVSQSLISRFLTIGNLLRRLEILLTTFRARSAKEGPTIHAYAHSLSTTISYLRSALVCNSLDDPFGSELFTTSAIWMHYSVYEEILLALSALYHREEDKLPTDYPPFDPAPVPLLSHIYDHLNAHFERQSPRIIISILAFILTNTSHEYIQHLSRSVGYGTGLDQTRKVSTVVGEKPDQYALDDEGPAKEDDLFEKLEKLEDIFPDFFPPELLSILPAAQKSLVLLQAAQPDHPILKPNEAPEIVRWFWTTSEIESAWSGFSLPQVASMVTRTEVDSDPNDIGHGIQPQFSMFKLFDLEPGSNFGSSTPIGRENLCHQDLRIFIDTFPESLPSITPTLSHLTSLVFFNLTHHASTLSNALLNVFTSSTDNLNFRAHLLLLRSYLLLTAPPFKSRLSAALFSDSEDDNPRNTSHILSVRSLRHKSSKKMDGVSQPWAVGLAPSLLERETWPPVGADLSFFLRTVIVDSFEFDTHLRKESSGQRRVLEEAEYRLGFAIRDLPVGSGNNKWLNPLLIEALDFLYMDYKPPHPLEVLITPEILLKYQRMFAFIIRLMRVESALSALFRMTRQTSEPLFPTLAPSNHLLHHFRFVAQSFVSNLSEYVFDTAIGGNFDPFVVRLSPEFATEGSGDLREFPDVFALAASHSALLDDILSACLLRSGQRAVGELLRHSLELVLEFSVAVGERHRGRIEEYQAALLLEEVSQKFHVKISTLVRVLRGLVDKNDSVSTPPLQGSLSGGDTSRKAVGGAAALHHLLVRLDLSNWWSTIKQESSQS